MYRIVYLACILIAAGLSLPADVAAYPTLPHAPVQHSGSSGGIHYRRLTSSAPDEGSDGPGRTPRRRQIPATHSQGSSASRGSHHRRETLSSGPIAEGSGGNGGVHHLRQNKDRRDSRNTSSGSRGSHHRRETLSSAPIAEGSGGNGGVHHLRQNKDRRDSRNTSSGGSHLRRESHRLPSEGYGASGGFTHRR